MANQGALIGSGLSQTNSAIMGVGVSRSLPVHLSTPTASLSGGIWSTARAVALSCSGQGSHQLGYLVTQLGRTFDSLSGHC